MKRKLLLLTLLFAGIHSYGQEFRKYANNFLYHGVDARGRAMGNAIASSSEDVFASYWNPAGLSDVDSTQTQIGYMHVFDGLYNYDVAGVAIPTRKPGQTLGFTAIRYGVDDIPNTIFLVDESGNINTDNIRTFNAADYGGYFSYSRELNTQLSIGGSAKVLHRNVGEFAKAWGAGIDVGLKYTHKNNNLKAVAFAKDIFGTYTSWDFNFDDPEIRQVFIDTGNQIPEDGSIEANTPNLVLGGSYFIQANKVSILPEINLDVTFDGNRGTVISNDGFSIDPRAGLEIGYDNTVFLRGGINNIQELTDLDSFETEWTIQPSAGAGVQLDNIGIDYSLTQYDFRNELTHLISLQLGLNKPGTN